MKTVLTFAFLICFNLSFADEVCRPEYYWPTSIDKLAKQSWNIRYNLVKTEMVKFSNQVGTCYNRKPIGKAERAWLDSASVERIIKVDSAKSVRRYCENVRKYLVEEKLPNPADDKSPYNQYANCEEGKAVGACLAYIHGFKPQDILLCDSAHDHAWALIREEGNPKSFCLLDRWNPVRCGVKLKGAVIEGGGWQGDVIVPGEVKFNFSDAFCNTLQNQFKS